MPYDNKRNLQYFESSSMRELYDDMENWQNENSKRLLSVSIEKEGESFCCIALTNPSEVVVTSADGRRHLTITDRGIIGVKVV